jgi:hypothetical protein
LSNGDDASAVDCPDVSFDMLARASARSHKQWRHAADDRGAVVWRAPGALSRRDRRVAPLDGGCSALCPQVCDAPRRLLANDLPASDTSVIRHRRSAATCSVTRSPLALLACRRNESAAVSQPVPEVSFSVSGIRKIRLRRSKTADFERS